MITWRLDAARAEEWRAIRLAALRDALESFGATLDDWQDRPLADFAERLANVPTFAAGRTEGEPLAVAAWQAGLDPSDDQRGWLLAVYARPEARGRGFAETAIRAAIADATAQGMTSIGLNVRDRAAHAQALYHRLGFRPSDRHQPSNSPDNPEIEMLRSLP